MKANATELLLAGSAVLLSACSPSGEDDLKPASRERVQTLQAPAPSGTFRTLMRTPAWLNDFTLGTAPLEDGTLTLITDVFAPGVPIFVTMDIELPLPRGTFVTAFWYGPDDQPLAYEIKRVTAGQERMSFMQRNTLDWLQGDYRAEVWIGKNKMSEHAFQIGG